MSSRIKYTPSAATKAAFRDLDSVRSMRQFSKLAHARSPRRRRLPGHRELEVQALIDAWILDREAMAYAVRDVLLDVVREAMDSASVMDGFEATQAMVHVAESLGIDYVLAGELREAAE